MQEVNQIIIKKILSSMDNIYLTALFLERTKSYKNDKS